MMTNEEVEHGILKELGRVDRATETALYRMLKPAGATRLQVHAVAADLKAHGRITRAGDGWCALIPAEPRDSDDYRTGYKAGYKVGADAYRGKCEEYKKDLAQQYAWRRELEMDAEDALKTVTVMRGLLRDVERVVWMLAKGDWKPKRGSKREKENG